jgi:hypothetical protein
MHLCFQSNKNIVSQNHPQTAKSAMKSGLEGDFPVLKNARVKNRNKNEFKGYGAKQLDLRVKTIVYRNQSVFTLKVQEFFFILSDVESRDCFSLKHE